MNSKNVLLINPPSRLLYKPTKIREAATYSPVLSLATISAPAISKGYNVKIIDANIIDNLREKIRETLKELLPKYVGITFTTPLYKEMLEIVNWIKNFDSNIIVIAGGAHVSSLPQEALEAAPIDIAVRGEGDFALLEILENEEKKNIKGISYKKEGRIFHNPLREYIKDLDSLPFPAWQLYDIKSYKTTDILARESPSGWLETSRGCPYQCPYCNKSVFGNFFRAKSPNRVVEEIKYMLGMGFREIHISDDGFSTDLERAKEICNIIIKKKLKFPWATVTGIRIDRVDRELLRLMKEAGCYRVYYGIESGDQRILDYIHKGITLAQIKNAVQQSREVGLETVGYFMMGLPGESIESMQNTIDFARSLDLDMAKVSITIPLPSTALYDELERGGYFISKDWEKFNVYIVPRGLYRHPQLDWDTIEKFYKRFYRSFYLNPKFIFRRFRKDLRQNKVMSDARHFLKTQW